MLDEDHPDTLMSAQWWPPNCGCWARTPRPTGGQAWIEARGRELTAPRSGGDAEVEAEGHDCRYPGSEGLQVPVSQVPRVVGVERLSIGGQFSVAGGAAVLYGAGLVAMRMV